MCEKGKPGPSRIETPEHLAFRFKQGAFMNESTKDQAKGKAREIKGRVKKGVGHALNRPDMEQEGANEETAGKVQRKVGEVEKVFGV
jgi:uncharacterized protein YjbJ (UPF0337 family)